LAGQPDPLLGGCMCIKNLLKLIELYANKKLNDQERLWVCGFALIRCLQTLEG